MNSGILVAILAWLAYRAIRGRTEYTTLKADVARGSAGALETFLRRGLLRKGVSGIAAMLIVTQLSGRLPFNFSHADPGHTAQWMVAVAALMALSIIYFRRSGDRQLRFLLRTAGAIIPKTARETQLFLLFSLAAGLEEEVVFRWLLTSLFVTALNLGVWEACAASSVVFGAVHLYQGWKGMILTGLLGYAFAYYWVQTGSLWVVIFAHALIDGRLAAILTPERIRSLQSSATTPTRTGSEQPNQQ